MRVFDFQISVAAVDDHDDLEGTVISAGGFDGDFSGGLVSDDALDGVVQPRTSTPQVADMEVYRNGVRVERALIQGDLTVERDYDNVAQGWGISCPLTTPGGVFGSPFNCVGPALGRDELDFYGIYATPSGVYKIKLLSDGIVDNSTREASDQGLIENFSGVDRAGRFDGVKVTKQFPPGHGLYRGRVCREVMRAAGETRTNFEDGARMQKEIQLVDGEPIPTLAEILEVENRRILWDSDGYCTNPRVGRVRSDESPAFSFEERDLLKIASVKLDSVSNVVTLVIANGTRQKTRGPCSLVYSTVTTYEYVGPYTRVTSAFHLTPDGGDPSVDVYTPVTPSEPEGSEDDPVLVKKTQVVSGYKCDTLVHQITTVWGMARQEVPRYRWYDKGGLYPPEDDFWSAYNCYTDDDSGVGGGPAYSEATESFRMLSISETFNYYAASGYELPLPNVVPYYDWRKQIIELSWWAAAELVGSLDPDNPGPFPKVNQVQGSVTFVTRFGHVEGSVKTRGTTTAVLDPWNEVYPDVDQAIWGNGTGVNNGGGVLLDFVGSFGLGLQAYDSMIPWSATVTALKGDENNFVAEDKVHQWEWAVPDGRGYYYTENSTKSEAYKSLRHVSTVHNSYSADKGTHSVATVVSDEVEGGENSTVVAGVAGNGPSIERIDDVAANPDIYEDGEQDELAGSAARGDTEQIIVTVPFDFLLTCHMPREVVVEFPWAENAEELQQMAEALVEESASMPVFFTLPANFLIREAMPIHLLYRPFGIDHDIRVKTVRWKRSPLQPILTEIEARLYGW